MTALQLEVLEAFRAIDIPEDKAAKAAAALSTAFTKSGFDQDAKIDTIAKDVFALKLDNVTIKGELVLLRWMGGLLLTMVTAILFKLFLH
ncbi:MAG: hypothetical protein ACRYGP_05120 [Janthinobacterium lividum]